MMRFSAHDVIDREKKIVEKEKQNKNLLGIMKNVLLKRNPNYHFTFHVPSYLYIRANQFCRNINRRIDGTFIISDLVRVLYEDFLEYAIETNNIDAIFKKLQVRDLSPAVISTGENSDYIFEEVRGYEQVIVELDHESSLQGEFILRDMIEIYKDHNYTLENILEIIFVDFIDDFRKGLIKNPMDKIINLLENNL